MNEILYGVGRCVIEPFGSGTGDIIAAGELKDANVTSTYSMEDITGGNKAFPLASFPKDKSLKFSATNTKFSISMLSYQDGVSEATTANNMIDVMTFRIPAGLVVTLPHLAIAGSIKINGMEVVETTAVAGKFVVASTTTTTVTFAMADAGKLIDLKYSFAGAVGTKTLESFQSSMNKPFQLTYIFDVYDDTNTKIFLANLVIYKAKSTSGFALDFAHQTASTQKFEAEAGDPQRADEKLWDISFAPIT